MQIEAQHADQLRNQQLILYETLLRSTQAQTLLSHQPFIRPLIDLLNQFDNGGGGSNAGGGGNVVMMAVPGGNSASAADMQRLPIAGETQYLLTSHTSP